MRTCNWYRVVILCLLSSGVLGVLNIIFGVVPPQEPCTCDCSGAISRQKAELKVFYEHEIYIREQRIERMESEAATYGSTTATKTPEHRLAVLVPFRDRHEELQEFVPHIHQFLTRQNVHHDIWIINQADSHRFNRASLLNAGFLLSRDHCDYIVMHDVDLLPQNDDLKYSYPSSGPYHISSPSLHPLYHYKTFVGGVLSLTREQFERVNGLSNMFWGWGREDDELYLRMQEAGMKVQYPTGITTGYKTFRHNHDKKKRPRDETTYYDKNTKAMMRDRTTGLNTLNYTVVSHLNMTMNSAPYHFINIELYCDTNITPHCDK